MTAPTWATDVWATALLAAALLTPDSPELPADLPRRVFADYHEQLWMEDEGDPDKLRHVCPFTGEVEEVSRSAWLVGMFYGPLRVVGHA